MSEPESVAAIVLAAGTKSEPVSEASGLAHKAMLEVGGRAVVNRVVEALRASRLVGEVVVVTAPDSPVQDVLVEGPAWVESAGGSFVDTIMAGLQYHRDWEQALLVTGDLPLLTTEAVDHFVAEALDSGAELCYSMVSAKRADSLYETAGHVVVRLRDGAFAGGNLALVSRQFVERQQQRLKRAFASRKNPIRLARLLGGRFIFRYLLGRLTVADIVQRVNQILGCEVMVVNSPYPEVSFDVDKPEHIAIAQQHLQER